MPLPSTVEIRYDGVDITNYVLFNTARFDAQANGGIGTFEFGIKDTEQTRSFITGKKVELRVDGQLLYGGWCMQIARNFAFPAVDTTTPSTVTTRQFTVRGVNYNAVFERLVLRNPSAYTDLLPTLPGGTTAGAAVRYMCQNYLDLPAGFTFLSVDEVGIASDTASTLFAYKNAQQGLTFGENLEWISLKSAAVYYVDAAMDLHFHAPEAVFSAWGFSDRPNYAPASATPGASLYGFRELDATEDITDMANDALVWGGSEYAGENPLDPVGEIVFARRTNAASISTHGRWQVAEDFRGQTGPQSEGLGIQEGVDARAEAIVGMQDAPYIPPGARSDGVILNRSMPNQALSLAWYGHDIPAGGQHLVAGNIVPIVLYVHGTNGTPLVLTLPLRQVSISFPTLSSTEPGKAFVRFDGSFGLSLSDPQSLWRAILKLRRSVTTTVAQIIGADATTAIPGANWSGAVSPVPNGSVRVFSALVSGAPVRYATGTSEVYLNGYRLRPGSDYAELPSSGQINMFTPPKSGSDLWMVVRLV